MYNSIYELPSEVNDALGPDDRVVWYEAYNKCDPHTEDEVYEAKKSAWRACTDLPSSFSFKIIASADAVDIDHEIIDVPSVKASMDSFIKAGGNLNFNHSNYRVGVVYDWEPIDVNGAEGIAVYGNLFGNNLVAKSVRERFVKGANSLSIAGEADKGRYMCDDKGCYTRRQVAPNGLMEISITSNPANKACTLIDYHEGKSFAKSAGSRVMEYTIHKTYDECPILKLKKAFMDCGIEAHAREDGVFLPMDGIGFAKAAPIMKAAGLVYEQVDGGAMANYRDFALERSFKKASDEGLIDGDGVFTSGLTSDTFRKAVDDGLVYFRNGEFRYIEPTDWDAIFKEVRKSRATELFGEEGQKAIDENGQHKLGIHWNAVNEGVSGMNGANMHAQIFNPELFTPMSGPLIRRDQKQGYYDAIVTPNKHDKKYTDAERAYRLNNPTGFTTELYPDAKVLHLRSPKDWYDTGLYDKVSSWEDLAEYYDVIDYDGFSPNFDVRGRIGYPKDGREAARMSNEALNGAQIRHRWLKNQDPGVDLDREILSATSRNRPPSIKSSSARIILNPYAVMNSRLVTRGEDGTAYVDGVPVSKLSPRVTEWKPYDREAALQKLGELYIKAGITPRWYKPTSVQKSSAINRKFAGNPAVWQAAKQASSTMIPAAHVNFNGQGTRFDPAMMPSREEMIRAAKQPFDAFEDMYIRDRNAYAKHSIVPALYASRMNSGTIPGSTGFMDQNLYRWETGPKHKNPDNAQGFKFKLNPQNHYIVNSVDDWINLVKRFPDSRKTTVYRRGPWNEEWDEYEDDESEEDWTGLNFEDMFDKGNIYSIEYPYSFFEDFRNPESRKKLSDSKIATMDIGEMWGEPQIHIYDPKAMTDMEDYNWNKEIDMNSKGGKAMQDNSYYSYYGDNKING